MEVDLRFKTMEAGRKLFDKIEKVLAKPEIDGIKLDYKLTLSRPPLGQVSGTDVLRAIVKETGEELGIPYKAVITCGMSDGNLVCGFGVPTIDGLGPVGGRMCSPDEYLEIDTLAPRSARLAATIDRLAQK